MIAKNIVVSPCECAEIHYALAKHRFAIKKTLEIWEESLSEKVRTGGETSIAAAEVGRYKGKLAVIEKMMGVLS